MHAHKHACTHTSSAILLQIFTISATANCWRLYELQWFVVSTRVAQLASFWMLFFFTFLGCFRLTQQWYQAVQQIVTQVQRRRNAPKIGRGARSLRYLVHRKFRVKKGTFKYCLPQKWGVHVPPQFLRLCMCDDRAAISTATQFVSYLTNFNSLQGVTRKLSQMVKHRSAAQCAWCLVQLASFAI